MYKKFLFLVALVLLVPLSIFFSPKIIEHYHWIKTALHIDHHDAPSLALNLYQADIQAKKLEGISDDISGLTYNTETDTLFGVTNDPSQIVELTKVGDVLRIIPVEGIPDVEGIAHIRHNQYVITEEASQRLHEVKIDQNTQRINKSSLKKLKLSFGKLKNNKGLEGVEWDASRESLFVVKEKHPIKVFEIKGFPPRKHRIWDIEIQEWIPKKSDILHLTDLSSIFVHQPTGNIVLLAEESKLIAEYDYEGHLISMLKLKQGYHKLESNVPQAEGLAIDSDDIVYVVSEPNLFYRFIRK